MKPTLFAKQSNSCVQFLDHTSPANTSSQNPVLCHNLLCRIRIYRRRCGSCVAFQADDIDPVIYSASQTKGMPSV